MFEQSKEALEALGAEITTREIAQQPELWLETLENYEKARHAIQSFLETIAEEHPNQRIHVIFTGAGTSQYVGDSITGYLRANGNRGRYQFDSLATTDLVSAPQYHLFSDEVVLLVSFARSGNSPESLAAVELAEQLIPNLYQLVITCAPEGELAKRSKDANRTLLLMMPERSNDAGFAMTGSFTCMMLTALLIFDERYGLEEKRIFVKEMSKIGSAILEGEESLADLLAEDINRLVYLGSGSLSLLTREAQLKILELTAGQMATMFDSSMGFRHGPKSFVNQETLVIGFVNNHPYTRQYDLDILEEVAGDAIAKRTVAITQNADQAFSGETIALPGSVLLPDAYLAFTHILVAQVLALLASVKVGNTPDTPSASGTVNRVVKGVTIHPYTFGE